VAVVHGAESLSAALVWRYSRMADLVIRRHGDGGRNPNGSTLEPRSAESSAASRRCTLQYRWPYRTALTYRIRAVARESPAVQAHGPLCVRDASEPADDHANALRRLVVRLRERVCEGRGELVAFWSREL
jgi:hypothetical protein